MKTILYHYPACSTCKKARAVLESIGTTYDAKHIVETPPSTEELRRALEAAGGNIKKLLNTSGEVYREMRLAERLPTLSENEVIELLTKNGKLIKRPVLLAVNLCLVGFNEAVWREQLS